MKFLLAARVQLLISRTTLPLQKTCSSSFTCRRLRIPKVINLQYAKEIKNHYSLALFIIFIYFGGTGRSIELSKKIQIEHTHRSTQTQIPRAGVVSFARKKRKRWYLGAYRLN
jgi:hypothetical protein